MRQDREGTTPKDTTPVRDAVRATQERVRDVILRRDRHTPDRELARRKPSP